VRKAKVAGNTRALSVAGRAGIAGINCPINSLAPMVAYWELMRGMAARSKPMTARRSAVSS
jgi:hypothetical protein